MKAGMETASLSKNIKLLKSKSKTSFDKFQRGKVNHKKIIHKRTLKTV